MPRKTSKPAQITATQEYAKAHVEIDALLEIIRARLPHGDCRGATWSEVGTLQHVRARLVEIAAGLDTVRDQSEQAACGRLAAEVARISKERA